MDKEVALISYYRTLLFTDVTAEETSDIFVLYRGRLDDDSDSENKHSNESIHRIQYKPIDSLGAEIYCWGNNDFNQLGLGPDHSSHLSPRLLPLSTVVYLQIVRSIACSHRHTLLVTWQGSLYSCGDNSDGALGLRDNITRDRFTLIDWEEAVIKPTIISIACGSATIGCHSMAIDSEGQLYGWGVAQAVGLSKLKPYTSPSPVHLLDSTASSISTKCVAVSCGDAFTVAISSNGQVFSWGQWTNGRLGLGYPPIQTNRRSRSRGSARYQLSPKRVLGLESAVKIACGSSHTLCLLSDGSLLSWGQNCFGQIGCGTSSGLMSDQHRPVTVRPFQSYIRTYSEPWIWNWEKGVKVIEICAGDSHSLAVDNENCLWSWGTLNETLQLPISWTNRLVGLVTQAKASTDSFLMIPFELKSCFDDWIRPTRLKQFTHKIRQLAAGKSFTSVLTEGGRIWFRGTGPTIPPVMSRINDNEDSDLNNVELQEVRSLRCPSTSWLREISNKHGYCVYGGANSLFVFLDGETVSHSFTRPLLNRALTGRDMSKDSISLDESFDSEIFTETNSYIGSYLTTRGNADCVIISSGKVFAAHRAILSKRCPGLRDLIISESDISGHGYVQILLPELSSDTTRSLLHFIYNDSIPSAELSLLHSLATAAKTLQLPILQTLCDNIISEVMKVNLDVEVDKENEFFEKSPCSLTRDLGRLVGDPQFADIRFIIEGKALYSHKFILVNRCDYFSAMFRSGMAESDTDNVTGIIDIVVPDSYVSFLRLLIYIYTDNILDGSVDVLLQDIILADRLGLDDMKISVENTLIVNRTNWPQILEVADLINSSHLQNEVVRYLASDMSSLSSSDISTSRYSHIFEEVVLLSNRRGTVNTSPSNDFTNQIKEIRIKQQESRKKKFSFAPVILVIIGFLAYQILSNVVSFGYLIPIVNICGLAAILTYDGQAIYGSKFHSAEYFLHLHLQGAGTSDCDHWHDGAGILPHHVAITLQLEQSLQSIDPSISIPYWEYGQDRYLYDHWYNSVVFDKDWFGENSPSNSDHKISDGSIWQDITTPAGKEYLDWDITSSGSLNPFVNAYGMLRSPWNNNPSNYIGRHNQTYSTDAFDGFPECKSLKSCFDSRSMAEFSSCFNGDTHGPVHVLIGGAWNEPELLNDHDVSFLKGYSRLLLFKVLWRMGYTRCPTSCDISKSDECSCSVPDEYINTYGAKNILTAANAIYPSSLSNYFAQFTSDEQYLKALKVLEDPGYVGEMYSSGASFDPTFWPIHGDITDFEESFAYPDYNVYSGEIYLQGRCDWSNVKSIDDLTLPTCSSDSTCSGHDAND
eukprot:gene20096-26092_t